LRHTGGPNRHAARSFFVILGITIALDNGSLLSRPLTPTLFYENPFPVKPVFSHFDIPVALWSDIGAHL
jgi:hypothetical protein